MALVWVFQCSEGRALRTVTLTTDQYGSCQNGKGSWLQIDSDPPPFDIADLDTADLGAAFAAGFVLMATGQVIAFGFRMVLKAIKEW